MAGSGGFLTVGFWLIGSGKQTVDCLQNYLKGANLHREVVLQHHVINAEAIGRD